MAVFKMTSACGLPDELLCVRLALRVLLLGLHFAQKRPQRLQLAARGPLCVHPVNFVLQSEVHGRFHSQIRFARSGHTMQNDEFRVQPKVLLNIVQLKIKRISTIAD